MCAMSSEGESVYEARYGWTGQTTRLVLVSAVFVAAGFVPTVPLWLSILEWVLFGAGTLLFVVGTLNGKVALRVDENGVTLGSLPMRPVSTTAVVPWSDIEAIVLFDQDRRMRYIGLKRRDVGTRLPGTGPALGRSLIPHVDGDVVDASRPINGWRLDRTRLAAAVARYAPEVPIIAA